MEIGKVYICKITEAWFTRTSYCGKYLYALHLKLHEPQLGLFEKIMNLGENMNEIKRLAALFLKTNKVYEMEIVYKEYIAKIPFYARSDNNIFYSKNSCPLQFLSWAFPLSVYWDKDLRSYSVSRYDDIKKNIRYMYESGRFVEALSMNGKYVFPINIDKIQSYPTETIDLDTYV